MKISLNSYPTNIIKEFDYEKNKPLIPEHFTVSSGKKVWWKCLLGHKWLTSWHARTKGQGCPYCANKKASNTNNLKYLFPKIAEQWHPTKNGELKPENVLKHSGKKVWWLCSNKHEWQSVITARTNLNSNCPYCANKKASNTNNLKYLFPKIAEQWHPTKNGELKPENVLKHSGKKVWWLCSNKHEWQTIVASRTSEGNNCPKCSNQSSRSEFRILSELETLFDEVNSRKRFDKIEVDIFIKDLNLAIEVDGSYFHLNKEKEIIDKKKNNYLKNLNIRLIRVRKRPLEKLSRNDVIVESDNLIKKDLNNVIYSILKLCKLKKNKSLISYLKNKNFVNEKSYNKYLSYFPGPIPSKSLALVNPKLVKEWHYEKNYPLKPEQFFSRSASKVWWKCSFGHEWLMTVGNRFVGQGCPYCSNNRISSTNNLKFLSPELASQWHPTKNKELKPEQVTKFSHKKVWWKCFKNHEWQSEIAWRSSGQNCPQCYRERPRKRQKSK
jgi:very-short-patch-repair endonuclease